ncbi:MAG: APC family permease [Candidatus Omnitrophica bacterium]|nr:APC family permease [Candidatus Omnitrophota bacterium]
MERKKVLGFWDLLLFSFCAIFGFEAISTTAAIGPSAISWWLICIVGYFLPFGLIAAELGSTYPEQGGIYVWVKKALGNRWAARTTWYYWIALPLWLPAIYIAFAEIMGHMFFPGMGFGTQILIGIVMIWITVWINTCPLGASKWVPNIGSIAKLFVLTGMVAAAVVCVLRNGGLANEITFTNILPNFSAAVIFIPMIIYNLDGCELLSSAAGETKDPVRDIPKVVLLSASVIAALYLIATFTVWAVVPIGEINVASGILQIFRVAFGDQGAGKILTLTFGVSILVTFFTVIIAWTLGQNRTVAEAARSGELPEVLGRLGKTNMAPVGAAVLSGIISTVVIVLYGFIAKNAAELFWHVLSCCLIVGLFSYLLLYPSFIILRLKDRSVARPYRIPGPDGFAIFLAVMAELFVLATILILLIQPGHDFMKSSLPIMIGVVITAAVGEILVARSAKKSQSISS